MAKKKRKKRVSAAPPERTGRRFPITSTERLLNLRLGEPAVTPRFDIGATTERLLRRIRGPEIPVDAPRPEDIEVAGQRPAPVIPAAPAFIGPVEGPKPRRSDLLKEAIDRRLGQAQTGLGKLGRGVRAVGRFLAPSVEAGLRGIQAGLALPPGETGLAGVVGGLQGAGAAAGARERRGLAAAKVTREESEFAAEQETEAIKSIAALGRNFDVRASVKEGFFPLKIGGQQFFIKPKPNVKLDPGAIRLLGIQSDVKQRNIDRFRDEFKSAERTLLDPKAAADQLNIAAQRLINSSQELNRLGFRVPTVKFSESALGKLNPDTASFIRGIGTVLFGTPARAGIEAGPPTAPSLEPRLPGPSKFLEDIRMIQRSNLSPEKKSEAIDLIMESAK